MAAEEAGEGNLDTTYDISRRGAHGNTIAFLHPKSTGGVLIELCQPAERR